MKGRCRYCGKRIHESCIRCDICDLAWEEGRKHGENKIRMDVRESIIRMMNIADMRSGGNGTELE